MKLHHKFELIMLLGVLVLHLFPALSPVSKLLNWYYSDDAYFYFKTAQNISEGYGVTFDRIGPASGFHPLWMLICVPVFALARFDLFFPLRLLILISALFSAGSGILLYRLAGRVLSRGTAILVALFGTLFPTIHIITTQTGMESAVSWFCILLLLCQVVKAEDLPQWNGKSTWLWIKMIGIGLAAALALFSRLDNVFLVCITGVWFVFRRSWGRGLLVFDIALAMFASLGAYFKLYHLILQFKDLYAPAVVMMMAALVLKPLVNMICGLYSPRLTKRSIISLVVSCFIATSAGSAALGLVMMLLTALRLGVLHAGFSWNVIFWDFAISMAGTVSFRLIALKFGSPHLPLERGDDQSPLPRTEGDEKSNLAPHHTDADVALLPPLIRGDGGINSGELLADLPCIFQRGLAYFAPLGLLLGAYMIWSYLSYGTPSPVSGQIKQWWGTLPDTVYGVRSRTWLDLFGLPGDNQKKAEPWALITQPLFDLARRITGDEVQQGTIATTGGVVITLICLLGFYMNRRWVLPAASQLLLLPLAASSLMHIWYYNGTGYIATRTWYWVQQMLLLVLLLGLLVDGLVRLLYVRQKPRFPKWVFTASACLAGLVLVAVFSTYILERFPPIVSPVERARNTDHDVLVMVRQLEQFTTPDSIIGCTGGGEFSYFINDRTIVNLDGLMNTTDYFNRLKSGQTAEYFQRIGLDYVYAQEWVITQSDPYRGVFSGHLKPIKRFMGMVLYKYTGE